jgi:sec-independent protein translocase protein TatA
LIPGLPQVGGMELFIVLVIILLFFGASRVPELARSLGRGKQEFHKGVEETSAEAEAEAEKAQPEKASSESEGGRSERASQPQ